MTVSRRTLALSVPAALLGLSACSGGAGGSDENAPLKVGALPVPAGEMLTFVKEKIAPDAGFDLEFVEFNDYNTPNPALTDGSTDANLFQNAGFMETYNEQAGSDLISLGPIYLPAAAVHANDVADVNDLPEGATVAIPNDPTNEGRALELLASAGIIEIAEGANNLSGVTANPKNLTLVEVENATLPMALQDNDAAFVTAAFAIPAGLTQETVILSEDESSKYYNVLATRPELKDDPRVTKLHEALRSQEVKDFINENWKGLIIPAQD